MSTDRPILIAFDGSSGARHAIDTAGELLPGRPAAVLCVWEPLLVELAHHPLTALAPIPLSASDEDAKSEATAQRVAEDGARLARWAGLDARAVARADVHSVAEAIVGVAEDLDVGLIVTGSRGLHGFRARGSVSEHVLEHADRPVLVVPGTGAKGPSPDESNGAGTKDIV